MANKRFVATTFEDVTRRDATKGSKLAGKTVVQILPALNKGGVERGTIEIANAIVQEGGRAIVISNGGQLEANIKRCGGEHYSLPVHSKNPFRWPFIRRRVKQVLALTGADLVHIRSRAPAWIAMPAARSLGLPVVTTIHGRFRRENIFKSVYNRIMMKSDRIIAISKYISRMVFEVHPQVASKIKVIHRGVDLTVFSPDRVPPQRIIRMSSMLDVPDDRPIIMLPSRPTGWKGADALIDAAGQIADEKDFFILLVGASDGSAEYQKGLIQCTERHGLSSRVRLCPSVDDMAAALMLADVVVMPSTTPEPFGRVAIEASAMGCPVVAFNHGGAVESIIHGETGWLAKPGDTTSLALCLSEALSLNQKERTQLAFKARDLVESKFSTTKMCTETISIYTALLKKRNTGRKR